MSWLVVGVGTMTAVGAYQGSQKEKAQKKRNLAAAEANRYTPFTGQSYSQDFSADGATLGGAMQGATSGLMMGQQFGKMGTKPTGDVGVGDTMTNPSAQAMTATGNPSQRMWTSDMMKQGNRRTAF